MLKYKHFSGRIYTEAILSHSTQKLLWFEISNMLIAVLKNKFIELFIIIFGKRPELCQCPVLCGTE